MKLRYVTSCAVCGKDIPIGEPVFPGERVKIGCSNKRQWQHEECCKAQHGGQLPPMPVCKHWKSKGACAYGDACLFSHPPEVLENLQRPVRDRGAGKRPRVRNESRVSIFRSWLMETYGREYLSQGSGVLDVAAGKGELAFQLINLNGIPCTAIDPRPLEVDRYVLRFRYGMYHRGKVFENINTVTPECFKSHQIVIPPHIRMFLEPGLGSKPSTPPPPPPPPPPSSSLQPVDPETEANAEVKEEAESREEDDDAQAEAAVEAAVLSNMLRAQRANDAWEQAGRDTINFQSFFDGRTVRRTEKGLKTSGHEEELYEEDEDEDEDIENGGGHGGDHDREPSESQEVEKMRCKLEKLTAVSRIGAVDSTDGPKKNVEVGETAGDLGNQEETGRPDVSAHARAGNQSTDSDPTQISGNDADFHEKEKEIVRPYGESGRGRGHIVTEEEYSNSLIQSPGEAVMKLRGASVVLGMHPDQAVEGIVDFALASGKLFAVVPCCVYAAQFTRRRLPNGKQVKSYDDLLLYLKSKDPRVQIQNLPFEGKNKVVFIAPSVCS